MIGWRARPPPGADNHAGNIRRLLGLGPAPAEPRAHAVLSRVTYWLVNSGTTEEPWLDRLFLRYRAWNDEHGDVQMFPFRPASVAVGDVLIHRVVGSPACELIAVVVVIEPAHPSGGSR